MTLLLGLYYFYRQSPKMKQGLKRSFKALNIRQVLPTRVGGTRWMPQLSRSIDYFFKGYNAIRNHLETASYDNPKAEGLVKIARDGHIIVFLLSLKELLKPLVRLSLCLQKEGLTLADASTYLTATKSVLEKLNTEDNESIKEVIENSVFMNEGVTLVELKPKPKLPDLISSVMAHIETRFPDSSAVLNATAVSNLRNWSIKNLPDYGVKEFEVVIDHFKDVLLTNDIEKGDILEEWNLLKMLIKEKFSKALESGDLVEL